MPTDSINVQVNGESRQLPRDMSVANLLADLGLGGGPVAVEINLQLVPRSQHTRQSLAEGDKIEIVTLVGGG